jgi:glutathione synthase
MKRSFLYIMDPIQNVDPKADTTFDFMVESQNRGVENHVCGIQDLSLLNGRPVAHTQIATVFAEVQPDSAGRHVELAESAVRPFDDFQVIWMRKDPPVDETFHLATMFLERHDPAKTLVLNDPSGLLRGNEKLWALFAPELGPQTVISSQHHVLVKAIHKWKKCVVKPLSEAGGAGVMSFSATDKNINAAIELLSAHGTKPIIAQEYIEAVRTGDKRIILIGGEPVGAILRVPPHDDNRANMHVGASVAKTDLSDRDRKICATLKPMLLQYGFHFVGIDVIGDKLTEVNFTSPTGVQELDRVEKRTGTDRVRSLMMDYVDGLLSEKINPPDEEPIN